MHSTEPTSLSRASRLVGCFIGLTGLLLAAATRADGNPDAPAAVAADGGRYYGLLVDGRRQGGGRVEWDNGAYFEGNFDKGTYSGHGRLRQPSGDEYQGEFEQGVESGHGRLLTAGGSTYIGDFRHGLPEGHGHYDDGNGAEYDGAFQAGRFHGHGKLIEHGAVYQGEFARGELEGQGEAAYEDGRKYRGGFVHGRFQGQGRFETSAGEVYQGQFERGEFTGYGTYARKDGGRHVGQFRRWRAEGEGRYTDPQGNVYEGQFADGEIAGPARLSTRDGARYEGGLKGWMPQGSGELRRANGDIYRGNFAYGVFEGEGTLTYGQPRADGRTQDAGLWHFGRLQAAGDDHQFRANVEAALYSQRALLSKELSELAPRDPNAINLYLLAVAGDGSQEVFRREVDFVRGQFDARFHTRGHSIELVNSRNTVEQLPMATVTSIRESLKAIAASMDREQDILFLFLTSHGSQDRELALDIEGMEFPALTAEQLGAVVRETGIRWKVVVVSACYGGGFIDALRDDSTLVIAAARRDRRSFGCADESDFTYFGRAFFKEALPESGSFQAAFARAAQLINDWEDKDASKGAAASTPSAGEPDYHSLPQMENPPAIQQYLQQWWTRTVTTASADTVPQPLSSAKARP
jgi:hypothetical protein